jgi:hypothetical protein
MDEGRKEEGRKPDAFLRCISAFLPSIVEFLPSCFLPS